MKSEPKEEEAIPKKRNPKESKMQETARRIVARRKENAK